MHACVCVCACGCVILRARVLLLLGHCVFASAYVFAYLFVFCAHLCALVSTHAARPMGATDSKWCRVVKMLSARARSAMEGKFYRYKTAAHPHTNMAKAALNMMTRTSAEDYARSNIYMNSVRRRVQFCVAV